MDAEIDLRHECRVFTRYLTRCEPDAYLLSKYMALQGCVAREAPRDRIDDALLAAARLGIMGTRVADAYARIFRPRTELRRKLILVLALAENSRGFHQLLTSGADASRPVTVLRIATSLAAFAFALITGVLVFTPLRIFPNPRDPRRSR